MSDSITPTTEKLIELLSRWPRQQVAEAILTDQDAQTALCEGRVPAHLGRRKKRKHAYGSLARGNKAVGYFDDQFPDSLRAIPDPPLVLYYQGDLALLAGPVIAIVGARRCTTQGRLNAQNLARDVASFGVHVASGLALGIDGAAHRGALQSQGPGKTIAILGAGLQQMYPRRHYRLSAEIVATGGLLCSEYPADKPPLPYQFPERNRLISGVSLATVVIEAGVRSGSLITARFAAEQGRDVLVMPGSVQSLVSVGCHRLIQDGAGLVTNAVDVIVNAGLDAQPMTKPPATANVTGPGQVILAYLGGYAVGLDELLAVTEIPAPELTQALVELELGGFVEQGPLGYIRTS